MTKASQRYIHLWLRYLEESRSNWEAIRAEFEQINRAWDMLSVYEEASRDDLIIQFANLLQNYLEFRIP